MKHLCRPSDPRDLIQRPFYFVGSDHQAYYVATNGHILCAVKVDRPHRKPLVLNGHVQSFLDELLKNPGKGRVARRSNLLKWAGLDNVRTCPTCHGDGYVTCPKCNGEMGSWNDGIWLDCDNCCTLEAIDGEIYCPICKGHGIMNFGIKAGLIEGIRINRRYAAKPLNRLPGDEITVTTSSIHTHGSSVNFQTDAWFFTIMELKKVPRKYEPVKPFNHWERRA